MVWSKLREELDRAGRVAQVAIDEGKVRLDVMRARQLADKAAQALGYALYRARKQGTDLDTDTYARLSSTHAGHEAEIAQLESRLEEIRKARRSGGKADETASTDGSADTQAQAAEPPAASQAEAEAPPPAGP